MSSITNEKSLGVDVLFMHFKPLRLCLLHTVGYKDIICKVISVELF